MTSQEDGAPAAEHEVTTSWVQIPALLLALGPQAGYLTSTCLSFSTCKMEKNHSTSFGGFLCEFGEDHCEFGDVMVKMFKKKTNSSQHNS